MIDVSGLIHIRFGQCHILKLASYSKFKKNVLNHDLCSASESSAQLAQLVLIFFTASRGQHSYDTIFPVLYPSVKNYNERDGRFPNHLRPVVVSMSDFRDALNAAAILWSLLLRGSVVEVGSKLLSLGFHTGDPITQQGTQTRRVARYLTSLFYSLDQYANMGGYKSLESMLIQTLEITCHWKVIDAENVKIAGFHLVHKLLPNFDHM
nr:unnamed protein product [Callosobruchus chinensis]